MFKKIIYSYVRSKRYLRLFTILSLSFFFFLSLFLFEGCKSNDDPGDNIVNGKPTTSFSQVLRIKKYYETELGFMLSVCSGVVVAHNTMLTAAHCLGTNKEAHFTVDIPSYLQKNPLNTVLENRPESIAEIAHEGFQMIQFNGNKTLINDIAVLIFPDNTFEKIEPLSIYKGTPLISQDTEITIVGLGKNYWKVRQRDLWDIGGEYDRRQAHAIISSYNDYCLVDMIQISLSSEKIDSPVGTYLNYEGLGASGDSGGPILAKFKDGYKVLGVLSGGNDDEVFIKGYSCYAKVNYIGNRDFLRSVGTKYNVKELQ